MTNIATLRERETDRQTQTDRQTETGRDREYKLRKRLPKKRVASSPLMNDTHTDDQ